MARKKSTTALRAALAVERLVDQPVGLSVLDPVVARPKSFDETAKNRRVEFRLYPTKPAQPTDKDVLLYPY